MTLIKRSTKGTALTYAELDGNFTHLGGDGSYAFPSTDGSANQVLATNGNGQLSFVAQTGGGIALTDLSVTTGSASGSGSLSYNNTTGAFTFAPPDLSTYLTTVAFSDLTGKPTTIAGYGITDAFDGAFSSLTGKPTTIAGYGITDSFDGATSSLTGDIDLATQVTGILPVSNMAATALTTVQTASNESAQLALTTEEGDVVVRSDENKTYMHNGGSAGTMADFTLLATPTDAVTSVDGNTGAVTTLQLGTSSTTALAGNTTFAFADITSTPTTIAGYGITDALQLGTSSTTALAGNTTFAFADITSKPTTISGYGITDALQLGTSSTTALAGDTTFAFADITSKPTTIAGYGITDALQLGTSSTTALAGDTALLQLGTSATTAMAGNTTFAFSDITSKPTTISGYGITDALAIGTSATTAMAGNTTFAFADITSKPTTISGYGITDALAIGTSATTAMAGNTALSAIGGSLDLSSQVTGTLPVGNMSATALTTVQTAANQAAQLALTTQEGDVVVRTDENKTYMRNSGTADPHDMTNFTLLATPTDAVTSVDGNTGVVTTLQIGTSATTAMAGNTTFAFSDITSKPTTISGYGITDALTIGTSGTTAMAGNTTFDRITEGDTSIIITDTGTPPSADNNIVVTVAGSQKAKFDYTGTEIAGGATNTQTIGSTTQTGTITLGRSTKDNTINIGNAATESDQEQIINIGSGTGSGTSTVNIAAKTSQGNDTAVTIGGNDPSTGTCTVAINGTTTVGLGNTTFQGNNFLVNPSLSTNTITLGSTSGTGTITIGRSTAQQDILIGAGATVPNSGVRHIQLGELSTGVRKITLEPSNNTVDVMCNANSLNQQLTGINLYNTPTTGNTATTGFQFGGYLGQNKITSYYGSGSSADILMNFAMGGDKFIFTGLGRLGVGTTNPAQELHVVGDIIATGNVTAYYSDERLKDLKGAIPNALEKVNKLTGYYYTPNDLAHSLGVDNTGIEVGVSAQEVESVLPEVVTDSAVGMSEFRENYKTVQYDRLTPLLIESIKELTQKVAELEAKLEERGE